MQKCARIFAPGFNDSDMVKKDNSKIFLVILLGMLTAFGPFVTDMYLPSLPSMAGYFDTTTSMVQLGLTTSMIGLAAGQIFFGPLSDKYGRRPLLLCAMTLFIVSTVLCIFAPDIYTFAALRLVQGIAGAGGIVISRSVATDKFSGRELAKMLAIVGAVNGVAPVAAPVIGGTMVTSLGWQGIFVVLLIIGCLLLLGCAHFKETLSPENRLKTSVWSTFRGFAQVVGNRRYLLYALQLAFAQGVLFAYIASSPFIMQQHYGFSPMAFSICFAVNAIVIGVAAGMSVKFRRPEYGTFTASVGMSVFALLEMMALSVGCSFWVYELLLLGLVFTLGLTFTTSTVLAMDSARKQAGAASAFLGAMGFAFGGIVSPLVGFGDGLTSAGIVFVVCVFSSLLCALLAIKKRILSMVICHMR